MESNDNSNQSILKETQLSITENAKQFLSEAGKWGKFISIVGFIAVGLLVVFGVFAGTLFSQLPGYEDIPGALFSIIYIVLAALYFFPILYLYRFSTKVREALNANDEGVLEYALENLKSHYKFIGILMIVMLALYALIFVFALIFGVLAA